jgi:hypothetical protein
MTINFKWPITHFAFRESRQALSSVLEIVRSQSKTLDKCFFKALISYRNAVSEFKLRAKIEYLSHSGRRKEVKKNHSRMNL